MFFGDGMSIPEDCYLGSVWLLWSGEAQEPASSAPSKSLAPLISNAVSLESARVLQQRPQGLEKQAQI